MLLQPASFVTSSYLQDSPQIWAHKYDMGGKLGGQSQFDMDGKFGGQSILTWAGSLAGRVF